MFVMSLHNILEELVCRVVDAIFGFDIVMIFDLDFS